MLWVRSWEIANGSCIPFFNTADDNNFRCLKHGSKRLSFGIKGTYTIFTSDDTTYMLNDIKSRNASEEL